MISIQMLHSFIIVLWRLINSLIVTILCGLKEQKYFWHSIYWWMWHFYVPTKSILPTFTCKTFGWISDNGYLFGILGIWNVYINKANIVDAFKSTRYIFIQFSESRHSVWNRLFQITANIGKPPFPLKLQL